MKKYSLEINGLPVEAVYPESVQKEILLPLITRLQALRAQKGRRICVFLAGPPAAGKSTLCRVLEILCPQIQAVGLDGFHYPNAYLETHFLNGKPLSDIKGAPETYDTARLAAKIRQIGQSGQLWPHYDRRRHDPVEDSLPITGEIIIVEGNWLLLDASPWNELPCDFSVFLHMNSPVQIERVINRKIAGGFDAETAHEFANRNDRANIIYCLTHSRSADMNIAISNDESWRIIP